MTKLFNKTKSIPIDLFYQVLEKISSVNDTLIPNLIDELILSFSFMNEINTKDLNPIFLKLFKSCVQIMNPPLYIHHIELCVLYATKDKEFGLIILEHFLKL